MDLKMTVLIKVLTVLLNWLTADENEDGVPDVLEPFLKEED